MKLSKKERPISNLKGYEWRQDEQRDLRLSAQRLRNTTRRATRCVEESPEQREMRLAAERLRISQVREKESGDQREARLEESLQSLNPNG